MLADAQFRRADEDGVPRLAVTGDIDLVVARYFREALHQLIDSAHSAAYVDMTGVTFFDSAGINALVHAKRAAERQDVDLVVAPSPGVRRILQIGTADQDFSFARPEAFEHRRVEDRACVQGAVPVDAQIGVGS